MPDRRNRIPINFPTQEFTEDQLQNARLNVARLAKDAEDLAFLLNVLDLMPKNPDDEPNDARERKLLRKRELAEARKAAKKKRWEEELSSLMRNRY